jgi:soluble lytic murein transglycosylase-like protein
LLFFLQQSAHADIWGYIDRQGVAHFAAERVDERYQIFFQGGESFDTRRDLVAARDTKNPALTAAAVPAAASRVLAFFDVSPRYQMVKYHMRTSSRAYQIDYELLQALIATESGFDVMAVSPKGAIGLMQLMPATAARYGVSGDQKTPVEKKLADPQINIKTGTRYLRDLINLFPGQLELALAAYNAGEGAVQRAGNQIPNYKETQNYVKTVMNLYTLLKPPGLTADPRHSPTRVRMQMQGGAAHRGNMISSMPSITPQPNLKTETD